MYDNIIWFIVNIQNDRPSTYPINGPQISVDLPTPVIALYRYPLLKHLIRKVDKGAL